MLLREPSSERKSTLEGGRKKTFFDGAEISSNGNPVVALTIRHDRLDSFWFTLMHEVAHLVLGHEGARLEDLDGDAGGKMEEMEADALAADRLVPTELISGFASRVALYFSRRAIWRFASTIGRHPAIALGRLQHDGLVSQAPLRVAIPGVRRMLEPFIDVVEPVISIERTPRGAKVAEPVAVCDPEGAVLWWLRGHSGWNSPVAVKDSLNLDRSTWNRVIRTLEAVGQVERTGEKRGTKYRATGEFE